MELWRFKDMNEFSPILCLYMDDFDIGNKMRRRLLDAGQPPTLKIFDIPVLAGPT